MDIGWLQWDPDPDFFTVPIINRPIRWYGLLFVLGFAISYFILVRMFTRIIARSQKIRERDVADRNLLLAQLNAKNQKEALEALGGQGLSRTEISEKYPKALYTPKQLSVHLADYLTWFMIAGTIIGARLGHVFLYDWPRYQNHPLDILKVWEGGLASHGGAVGIIIALLIFLRFTHKKFPEFTFVRMMDMLTIPAMLVGAMIRIGNFINQEIIGTPTTMPWGVFFARPADNSFAAVRHPVQLYEAAAYFSIFLLLALLWKTRELKLRPGFLAGLMFTLAFTARFFLEFYKEHQSLMIDESTLQTGQLLSLPFIALGIALMIWSRKNPNYSNY